MDKFFEILFLDETFEFLKNLDRKHYEKILYNIRKSQLEHNPELFKKHRMIFGNLEQISGASISIVGLLG
jgi:mRNA-degrading endonuclease RelE of RelBE toxin-antitoxin system